MKDQSLFPGEKYENIIIFLSAGFAARECQGYFLAVFFFQISVKF